MSESVRIEWGVKWPDDDEIEQDPNVHAATDGGEAYARRVAKYYRAEGAKVVQREVQRQAWKPAE